MKNLTETSKRLLCERTGAERRASPRRTPALAAWLMVLWGTLCGATVMAAEGTAGEASAAAETGPARDANEAAQAEGAQSPAAAADEEGNAGDAGTAGDDEVFVPTEEISEDFAVSFPVDI